VLLIHYYMTENVHVADLHFGIKKVLAYFL